MIICVTCKKAFLTREDRDRHCMALGHEPPEFECDSCSRHFACEHDRQQHMRDRNHFKLDCNQLKWDCNMCNETWATEAGCIQHKADAHFYCAFCDRVFVNRRAFKMHRNSKIHRADKLSCRFCKGRLATAKGLTDHLERGSCPNARQLNRRAVYRIVRSEDPNGVISKHLTDWQRSGQYVADARAYSTETGLFTCMLCQRGLPTLRGLNDHLKSPLHMDNPYHCPNPDCGLEFQTLVGVISHLESEACKFMQFEEVQKKVGEVFSGNS